MTTDELKKKLSSARTQEMETDRRIVDVARHLVPVLRDAHLDNQAQRLEELFFEKDRQAAELRELVSANPLAAFEAVLGGIKEMREGA